MDFQGYAGHSKMQKQNKKTNYIFYNFISYRDKMGMKEYVHNLLNPKVTKIKYNIQNQKCSKNFVFNHYLVNCENLVFRRQYSGLVKH